MLPNGVQATSKDVEGLVETSLNPGTMKLLEDKLVMGIAIRSSMESAKKVLQEKVSLIVEAMGGSCEISSDYPGWAYRVDSPFREKMAAVYERMYGKQPKIEAVHAGLECGILAAKIPNLDGISLGPDMQNVHTTEEKLSISSTKRMWEYLQGVLAEKSVTA